MWLKYIIIALIFFVLALFQTSFLPYFNIAGTVPNLVFILFFILTFFDESGNYYEGFFLSIIAGFLLDVFSPSYFGISIVSLLIIYFTTKSINYFLKEREEKYIIIYFLLIFLLCFFVYHLFLYMFLDSIIFNENMTIEFLYNLGFALIGFYPCQTFFMAYKNKRQLKLFK